MSSLTIHWLYLLPALFMLWFPRQWLRLGHRFVKVRRRGRNLVERFAAAGPRVDPDDKSVILVTELKNRRNYVDFFRGLGGALALVDFAFDPMRVPQPNVLFYTQAGILVVGVLIQTVRYAEKTRFFAPLFYLFGVGLAVAGLYVGLFAMLLVCASHLLLPTPRLFLGFYGMLVAGFFVLFPGDFWLTGVFVLMAWLPALLSLLARRSLITYSHKIRM